MLHHTREVTVHALVRKPYDVPPAFHQKGAPTPIVLDLCVRAMRCAVDFDDESHRGTRKVGHVGSDWMLPAKAHAIDRIAPKLPP
jgi:hypothetical protein